MARRHYTHKEHLVISNFMVIIILFLCLLIIDNKLGKSLSETNALHTYAGKCVKYIEVHVPKGRSADAVFYDIYMDNGLILSVPEDGLWDAGFHKYELADLIEQELTVSYYPGILPTPPARLLSAYIADRKIVTADPTIQYFSNQITMFHGLMIVPVIWLIPTLFWRLFQTSFWQRNWPKARKTIKQWLYEHKR